MNATTQREEEIFNTARSLADPAAREPFLARACAGKPDLRARLDRLLDAVPKADRIFAEGETALPVSGTSLRSTHSARAADSASPPLAGNSTRRGLPFLLMELVSGVRITDDCDQSRDSTALIGSP